MKAFLDPTDGSNDTTTLYDKTADKGAIYLYTYNDDGYRTDTRIKQGHDAETANIHYVSATDYYGGDNPNSKHLITHRYTYPTANTSRTATDRITTQHAYTFWGTNERVKQITTTLPAVDATHNGSGSTTSVIRYLDAGGRLRWTKDAKGYVNYHSYDKVTGKPSYGMVDVDTSSPHSDITSATVAWEAWSGDLPFTRISGEQGNNPPAALQLATKLEVDQQGRRTATIDPDGNMHCVVYGSDRVMSFPYWDTSSGEPDLPMSVVELNDQGQVENTYTAIATAGTISTSNSRPTGFSSDPALSEYRGLSTNVYDSLTGKLTSVYRYYNIPSSLPGSSTTDYDETQFGYDCMGRRNCLKSPGGTIARIVRDIRGQVVKSYVGTDDTDATCEAPDNDPNNDNSNNMKLVTEREYDDNTAGGNGNLTKITRHVDAGNTRVIALKYDWRNRNTVVVDPGTTIESNDSATAKTAYTYNTYDHLGRLEKRERYWDSSTSSGTYDTTGDRLLARTEIGWDELNRVYSTKVYAVNSSGTAGNSLESETWYDPNGHKLKTMPAGSKRFTKIAYDGAGRATNAYAGYDAGETSYSQIYDDVSGLPKTDSDTLLEKIEKNHDNLGNVQKSISHSAITGGFRTSYVYRWYDATDRLAGVADYGAVGSAPGYTAGSANIPTRSDTILVTTLAYDDASRVQDTTDPAAVVLRREYDDRGRTTKTIRNYDDSITANGGEGADHDANNTTEVVYNEDGLVEKLIAHNHTTGDQETLYVYGTSVGDTTPDIFRNDLLRAVIYPDSDDTAALGNGDDEIYDRVELKYNRLGEVTDLKDQNQTTHVYTRDAFGRLTKDDIGTYGTNIDTAVDAIQTAYYLRQRKVTSLSSAAATINEVLLDYNDFGQLATDYQEHDGAKDASTLSVQYAYADGTANHARPTSVTYPDGRKIHYTYGSATADDYLSRPAGVAEDNGSGAAGDDIAMYGYMGLAALVSQEYDAPGVELDYSANSYDSLDRFGRVTKQKWTDGSTGTYDHYAYGHDRLGNRKWRENLTTTSPHLDQAYDYDDLNRLVDADEGDLSDGTISAPTKQQEWGLDAGGNWNTFKDDNDANADWELEQTRVHNEANEIEDDDPQTAPDAIDVATGTTGADWADPLQDAVGNMTSVPEPDSPNGNAGCTTGALTLTFDAWNRLVEVADDAGTPVTIESYEFDGLHRRIEKLTAGSPSETLDFYYDGHQVVEERKSIGAGSPSSNPIAQYVWHPHYIDALAVRYYDSDTDGTLDGDADATDDGTHYYLQDANFNVTAVLAVITDGEDDITTVLERYHYTPYGEVTTYDADWANSSTLSRIGNPYLYTGRRLDAETGIYHYRTRPYHAQLGRFMGRDWILYNGGDVNVYNYVGNDPLNWVDPWGLYFGIDDLVFSVGGGLIGLAGQAAGDLLTGTPMAWESYAGAFVGGAVAGEVLLYAGPVAAGAAGGAAGNAVKQGCRIASGKQDSFDFGSLAQDTAIGAATGFIPRMNISGVTKGRGSFIQVFNQITTKAKRGLIKEIKKKTAGKMFVGRMTQTSALPGAVTAVTSSQAIDKGLDAIAQPDGNMGASAAPPARRAAPKQTSKCFDVPPKALDLWDSRRDKVSTAAGTPLEADWFKSLRFRVVYNDGMPVIKQWVDWNNRPKGPPVWVKRNPEEQGVPKK